MASDLSSTEVNELFDDEKEEGEISLEDVSSSEEGPPYKYPPRAFGQCPQCLSTQHCATWCRSLIVNKNNIKRDAGLQGKENRNNKRHAKDCTSDPCHNSTSNINPTSTKTSTLYSTLQEKNADDGGSGGGIGLANDDLVPISSDSDMELVGLVQKPKKSPPRRRTALRKANKLRKRRRKKSPSSLSLSLSPSSVDLALSIKESIHRVDTSIPVKKDSSSTGHSKFRHHSPDKKKLASSKSSPPPRRHNRSSPTTRLRSSPTRRARSPLRKTSPLRPRKLLKVKTKKTPLDTPEEIKPSVEESPSSRGTVTKLLKKVRRLEHFSTRTTEKGSSLKDKLSNIIKSKKDSTSNENQSEKKNENVENSIKEEAAIQTENTKEEVVKKQNKETSVEKPIEEDDDDDDLIILRQIALGTKQKKFVMLKPEEIKAEPVDPSSSPLAPEPVPVAEPIPEPVSERVSEPVSDPKPVPAPITAPASVLASKPASQKLPNFCMDDNDEDLELRMIALRSAVLKKHRARMQNGMKRKLKKSGSPIPRIESPFASNFSDDFPFLAEICSPTTSPLSFKKDIYSTEDMDLDSDMELDKDAVVMSEGEDGSPYSPSDDIGGELGLDNSHQKVIEPVPMAAVVQTPVGLGSPINQQDNSIMNASIYSPSNPTETPNFKPYVKVANNAAMLPNGMVGNSLDGSFLEFTSQESRPYSPTDATIYDPDLPGVHSSKATVATPLQPPPLPPLSMFGPPAMIIGCPTNLLGPFVEPIPMMQPPTNNFPALHQSVNPYTSLLSVATPMFAYSAPVMTAPQTTNLNLNPNVQTNITPSIQTSVQSNIQSSIQPNVQSSILTNVPKSMESGIQSIVQPNLQPIVQPNLQPIVQPNLQPSVQTNVQSEFLPSVQTNIQPNDQSNLLPNVQPSVQSNVQANIQPSLIPIVQPSVQTNIQSSVEQNIQPEVQSSIETTIEPSIQPNLKSNIHLTVQPDDSFMDDLHDLETDLDGSPFVPIEVDSRSNWPLLNEPLYLQGVPEITKSKLNQVPTLIHHGLVPAAVLKTNKQLQKQPLRKSLEPMNEGLFRNATMIPVTFEDNNKNFSNVNTMFKPIKIQPMVKKSVAIQPAAVFNASIDDGHKNVGKIIMETQPNIEASNKYTPLKNARKREKSPKRAPVSLTSSMRKMKKKNLSKSARKKAAREAAANEKWKELGSRALKEKNAKLLKEREKESRAGSESKKIEPKRNTKEEEKSSKSQDKRRRCSIEDDEETLRNILLASLAKRSKESPATKTQVTDTTATSATAEKKTIDTVQSVSKVTPTIVKPKDPTPSTPPTTAEIPVTTKSKTAVLPPKPIPSQLVKKPTAVTIPVTESALSKSATVTASTSELKRPAVSPLADQPLRKIAKKVNAIPASTKVVNNAKRFQNLSLQRKRTKQKISLITSSKSRFKVNNNQKLNLQNQRLASPNVMVPESQRIIINLNEDTESESEAEEARSKVNPVKNRPALTIPTSDFERSVDQFLKNVRQQQELGSKCVPPARISSPKDSFTSIGSPNTPITRIASPIAPVTRITSPKAPVTRIASPKAPVTAIGSPKASETNIGSPNASVSIGSPKATVKTIPAPVALPLIASTKTNTAATASTNVVKTTISTAAGVTATTVTASSLGKGKVVISTPKTVKTGIKLPIISTPQAVKHLPASQQEEYRRLKQQIFERERLKLQKSKESAASSAVSQTPPEKTIISLKSNIVSPSSSSAASSLAQPVTSTPKAAAKTVITITSPVAKPIEVGTLSKTLPKSQLVTTSSLTSKQSVVEPLKATPIAVAPVSKQSSVEHPKTTPIVVTPTKIIHSTPSINLDPNTLNKTASSSISINKNNVAPISQPTVDLSKLLLQTKKNPIVVPKTSIVNKQQTILLGKMNEVLNSQRMQITAVAQKVSSLRILTKEQINLKTSQMQQARASLENRINMDDLNQSSTAAKKSTISEMDVSMSTENNENDRSIISDRTEDVLNRHSPSILNDSSRNLSPKNPRHYSSMDTSGIDNSKQSWEDFKEIVNDEVQSLVNLSPEEQKRLLSKTEEELITKRHLVLDDITEMSGNLRQWEIERDLQNRLRGEIKKLRDQLRIAEDKLQQQKEKLNTIQPKVSTYHEKINHGRKECFRLSKICNGLGQLVAGSSYKVPITGAELLNNRIKEVANHTQKLRKTQSKPTVKTNKSTKTDVGKSKNYSKANNNSNLKKNESNKKQISINNKTKESSFESTSESINENSNISKKNIGDTKNEELTKRTNSASATSNTEIVIKTEIESQPMEVDEDNLFPVDNINIKTESSLVQTDDVKLTLNQENNFNNNVENTTRFPNSNVSNTSLTTKNIFNTETEKEPFESDSTNALLNQENIVNTNTENPLADNTPVNSILTVQNTEICNENSSAESGMLGTALGTKNIQSETEKQLNNINTETNTLIESNDSNATIVKHLTDSETNKISTPSKDTISVLITTEDIANSEPEDQFIKFSNTSSSLILSNTINSEMENQILPSNVENSVLIIENSIEINNENLPIVNNILTVENINSDNDNLVTHASVQESILIEENTLNTASEETTTDICVEDTIVVDEKITKNYAETLSSLSAFTEKNDNTESDKILLEDNNEVSAAENINYTKEPDTDMKNESTETVVKNVILAAEHSNRNELVEPLLNNESTRAPLAADAFENNTNNEIKQEIIVQNNEPEIKENNIFENHEKSTSETTSAENYTFMEEIALLELANLTDVPGNIPGFSETINNETRITQLRQQGEDNQSSRKSQASSMKRMVQPYESILKHLHAPMNSKTDGILCPYELMGTCNDGGCQFVHQTTSHCR